MEKDHEFRNLSTNHNVIVLKSNSSICHSDCPWKRMVGFYCSLFNRKLKINSNVGPYTTRCFECIKMEKKKEKIAL
jgi:hypothetical protein